MASPLRRCLLAGFERMQLQGNPLPLPAVVLRIRLHIKQKPRASYSESRGSYIEGHHPHHHHRALRRNGERSSTILKPATPSCTRQMLPVLGRHARSTPASPTAHPAHPAHLEFVHTTTSLPTTPCALLATSFKHLRDRPNQYQAGYQQPSIHKTVKRFEKSAVVRHIANTVPSAELTANTLTQKNVLLGTKTVTVTNGQRTTSNARIAISRVTCFRSS